MNFKKVLSILATLTVSLPLTMSVVACSNSKSNDEFSDGDSWNYLEVKHNIDVISSYDLIEKGESQFDYIPTNINISKNETLSDLYKKQLGFDFINYRIKQLINFNINKYQTIAINNNNTNKLLTQNDLIDSSSFYASLEFSYDGLKGINLKLYIRFVS